MPKMPHPGEDHSQSQPVRGVDRLLVAYRASRLNNGGSPSFGDFLDAVRKGKKSIGGGHRTLQRQLRPHRAQLAGIDAAHLPGPYEYCRPANILFRADNRLRLPDRLRGPPREFHGDSPKQLTLLTCVLLRWEPARTGTGGRRLPCVGLKRRSANRASSALEHVRSSRWPGRNYAYTG